MRRPRQASALGALLSIRRNRGAGQTVFVGSGPVVSADSLAGDGLVADGAELDVNPGTALGIVGDTIALTDSDLLAIAALSTTTFGRALLAEASATTLRATLALGTAALLASDTDTALAANSDLRLATQKAVKAYIDGLIAAADVVQYKGAQACAGNPNYPAADAGHLYIVSSAGKIGGASGEDVEAGDMLICKVDGTASGTQAAVGANWNIIQTNIKGAVTGPASAVSHNIASMNGTTGKVIEDSGVPFAQVPASGEKAALPGTDGTPGATNKYVTDSDSRLNQTALTLPQAILTLKPSMYLTLGSGGSGLTDQSGNGRNGTAVGSPSIGGSASLNSASAGSTNFNGSSQKITTTYAAFTAGAQRTFMGWANLSPLLNSLSLFGGLGANAPGFTATDSFGGVIWSVSGTSLAGFTGSWLTNGTVFWALTYDDTAHTAELFINGTSRGVFSTTGGYVTPGNLQIGQGRNSLFWHGQQSDFAVFERLLSPSAISWLYRIGTGHTKDWGLVTALPSGALYGDTCTFIAKDDNNGGIFWNLVYDGQGSLPWKVVGGPPLRATDNTSRTTTSTAYVSLTSPLTLTLPLAGDYDITIGGRVANSANYAILSYQVGATAASDADAALFNHSTGSYDAGGLALTTPKTSLAAATVITEKAKVGAGTGTFQSRRLYAVPTRVG